MPRSSVGPFLSLALIVGAAHASVADYPQPIVTTVVDTRHASRPQWSPDGAWIVYDDYETPPPTGTIKIYRVRPDGTGKQALTVARGEVPGDSGGPCYGASARWMLFQAEKAVHGPVPVGSTITDAGAGIYNDLMVLDHETGAITTLTDVGSGVGGEPIGGVLYPRFSPDGTRIAWGDFERTVPGRVFGDWRLMVADFVATPTPHLANVRAYDPAGGASIYEVQGWTPDGSGILFAGTALAAQHEYTLDLCRFTPATGALARLTRTSGLTGEPAVYEEQGVLSPRGDLLAVMSCAGHPVDYTRFFVAWLRTDLWIADPDGALPRQATFYNIPGTPQHAEAAGRVMISEMGWDPSGLKLVARVYFVRDEHDLADDDSMVRIFDFTPGAGGTTASTTTGSGTGGGGSGGGGGCGLGSGLSIAGVAALLLLWRLR
ncbi:MAG TPA: hypothetical protein VEL07_18525 [Planctomycetota bacterium]|nr:hypothetical protein [Planctomycetota bacterium]